MTSKQTETTELRICVDRNVSKIILSDKDGVIWKVIDLAAEKL